LDLTSATPQPLNRLRKLWREGRPTFGAIATIPSIQTVQIMARSGFDWIVVDLEHGPIDLGSAHAMITATSGTSCIPLARIAANEPWLAKAPMDIGALGINFPMICSREDAEKAVRSVRYPPRSTARRAALGPVSRAVSLGRLDAGLYGNRGR
jgi:4-hydroxy-2-oxoheptanedioate aldolase